MHPLYYCLSEMANVQDDTAYPSFRQCPPWMVDLMIMKGALEEENYYGISHQIQEVIFGWKRLPKKGYHNAHLLRQPMNLLSSDDFRRTRFFDSPLFLGSGNINPERDYTRQRMMLLKGQFLRAISILGGLQQTGISQSAEEAKQEDIQRKQLEQELKEVVADIVRAFGCEPEKKEKKVCTSRTRKTRSRSMRKISLSKTKKSLKN